MDRNDIGAFTATADKVQVLSSMVRVDDLNIDRPTIVAYLRGITPDKQSIALVHALEVGVKELQARRERFKA
jgi:hypothetical protein